MQDNLNKFKNCFVANQWLQIDIGPPTLITGVVTRGRGDTRRKQWVTRFSLSYSNDSQSWHVYKDVTDLEKKVDKVFDINTESSIGCQYYTQQYGLIHQCIVCVSTYYVLLFMVVYWQDFNGNADKDIERYHYLNSPFVARFIRIHPLEWKHHVSMRAGVIGCPHKGGFHSLTKELTTNYITK